MLTRGILQLYSRLGKRWLCGRNSWTQIWNANISRI